MDQQNHRKTELENYLTELERKKINLISKMNNLKESLKKEKGDVEKLQRRNFSTFFISVFGNKDQILKNEEIEAYEAELKYDGVKIKLEAIKYDIKIAKIEYDKILNHQVVDSDVLDLTIEEEKVVKEKNLSFKEKQFIEKEEVYEIIKEILSFANFLENRINQINSWSFFDMSGVGQVSDKKRKDAFDDANYYAENIQTSLGKLWTEINDIEFDLNIKIYVENFIHMADYFHKGLFHNIKENKKAFEELREIKKLRECMVKVLESLDLKSKTN